MRYSWGPRTTKGRWAAGVFILSLLIGAVLTAPERAHAVVAKSSVDAKQDLVAEILQLAAEDVALPSSTVATQVASAKLHGAQMFRTSSAARANAVKPQALGTLGYMLKAGKYHEVSNRTLAGAYIFDQKVFVCISFGALGPDGSKAKGTIKSLLEEMPNEVAAYQANTIWNQFGEVLDKLRTKRLAAALWAAENTLTQDANFMKEWQGYKGHVGYYAQLQKLDPGVLTLAGKLLQFGRTYGPLAATLKVAKTAVGTVGPAALTLTTKWGKVAAYGRVTTASVNANGALASTRQVTTNGRGQAAFAVRRTNVGQLNVQVDYLTPSWLTTTVNQPSKGHQFGLLAGSAYERGSVRATSTYVGSKATVSVNCPPNCDGQATATLAGDNRVAQATQAVFLSDAVRTYKPLYVLAGQIRTAKYAVGDGTTLTVSYCYVNSAGACVTARVKLPGKTLVVCPAKATGMIGVDCDCEGALRSLGRLTVPQAPASGAERFYRGVVKVNGDGVAQTAIVKAGASPTQVVPPSVRLKPGDRVQLVYFVFTDAAGQHPTGGERLANRGFTVS